MPLVEKLFNDNSLFVSVFLHLMLLQDLNGVSWNRDQRGRKRNRRSIFFSSNKALRCARMTRARKHLSNRSDSGSGERRKSVRFAAAPSCETEYRLGSTVGVRVDDFLEVLGDNDDTVSEDFPAVSAMRCFSISMSFSVVSSS